MPGGVGGDEIALPVRLFHLADVIEVFHRAGGTGAAIEVARARRGKQFDPAVVDVFCPRRTRSSPTPMPSPSWEC